MQDGAPALPKKGISHKQQQILHAEIKGLHFFVYYTVARMSHQL